MIESQTCIEFLKQKENMALYLARGLSSPRWDPIGKCWDIGYGTTTYPNGEKVISLGKPITESQATEYLKYYVNLCCNKINNAIKAPLNQSQFDACVCIAYNIGIPAFDGSTLLKIILNNPNNLINISIEFKKWVYSNGKYINGLMNRREEEAGLYSFKNELELYVSDLDLSLPIYVDYVKWVNMLNQ